MNVLEEHKTLNVAEAREWCRAFACSHYENFNIASYFLPKEKRDEYFTLYAFARGIDDVADDPEVPTQNRLKSLDHWEEMLRATYEGSPPLSPIFIALQPLILKYDMDIDLFLPMVDAFRMDQEKSRYTTWKDVLEYTKGSANPVGRWVLRIHGFNNPELDQLSDDVCTGLQLVNFLQDIKTDFEKRDRVYLPNEDLDQYEVSEKLLGEVPTPSQLRKLIEFEVKRAEKLLSSGNDLINQVGKPLKNQLILFHGGGRLALARIRQRHYDCNTSHIKVSKVQKIALLLRSLRGLPV